MSDPIRVLAAAIVRDPKVKAEHPVAYRWAKAYLGRSGAEK